MTAKNRITINLDDTEYAELRTIAAKSDRSLAWLGRRAITELLVRERKTVGSQGALSMLSAFDGGEGSGRSGRNAQ